MTKQSNKQKSAIKNIKEGQVETWDGLPWQAFALVGNKDDPQTWKLSHLIPKPSLEPSRAN